MRLAVFTVSGQDEEPGDRQNRGGFEKGGEGRRVRILGRDEPHDALHIIPQVISQNYRREKYQEVEYKQQIAAGTP